MNGKPLQTKLAIGEPGDAYEQEADRVAEQVMRMSLTDVSRRQESGMTQPLVQRRTPSGAIGLAEAPPTVHEVLRSPGQPLEPVLRRDMEQRFGYDFSQVRVHTGTAAEQSARDVNASAYIVGHSIAFSAGQFAPRTNEGQQLIAHELTHVVQQGGVSSIVQRKPVPIPIVIDSSGKGIEGVISNTWSAALRESPSRTSKVLADLPRGHRVTAKGGRFWIKVKTLINNKNLEGYVSYELLDLDYGPPIEDVLRLNQTVPIRGLASQQPNYADRAIRRIESAPLGSDITLIPRTDPTGQNGISIPKVAFFMDQDPLSDFVIEHAKVVYRSEAVAQEAMANANATSNNIGLNYAYYLRDGIIFPTILSETTIPNLMPYIRQRRDQELADLKATADLAEALAWWYVGARFPIKVTPGTGTGRLIAAGGRTLSADEMAVAQILVKEGRTVRALAESTVRTADFIVDGVKTELKTISNLTSKDISGALGRRILEGAGQAPHVIADVRQQAGMTWDLAQRAIRRAFGADTGRRIQQIRIIGRNFDTTVPRVP